MVKISLQGTLENGTIERETLIFPAEIDDSDLGLTHISVYEDAVTRNEQWRVERGVDLDEPVYVRVTDIINTQGVMSVTNLEYLKDTKSFGAGDVVSKPEKKCMI